MCPREVNLSWFPASCRLVWEPLVCSETQARRLLFHPRMCAGPASGHRSQYWAALVGRVEMPGCTGVLPSGDWGSPPGRLGVSSHVPATQAHAAPPGTRCTAHLPAAKGAMG